MLDDSYDIDDIYQSIQGGILIGLGLALNFMFFGYAFKPYAFFQSIFGSNSSNSGKSKYDLNVAINSLCGILFSAALVRQLVNQHIISFYPFQSPSIYTPMIQLILAGFLVGLGFKMTDGGHGLQELPSFKLKPFITLILVIGSGILTITYNLSQFLPSQRGKKQLPLPQNFSPHYFGFLCLLIPFLRFMFSTNKSLKSLIESIVMFSIGVMYGYGVMLTGLTQRVKTFTFLNWSQNWDPSLGIIFAVQFFVYFIFYKFMVRNKKMPLFSKQLITEVESLKFKHILGAVFIGIGWGFGGILPNTMPFFVINDSIRIALYWGVSFVLGFKLGQFLNKEKNVVAIENKKQ